NLGFDQRIVILLTQRIAPLEGLDGVLKAFFRRRLGADHDFYIVDQQRDFAKLFLKRGVSRRGRIKAGLEALLGVLCFPGALPRLLSADLSLLRHIDQQGSEAQEERYLKKR